jgi:hypothetical protein
MSNLEQEESQNPILQEVIHKDSPMKEMILQYVGQTYNPSDGNVTVAMIVDIMAAEFPEFVLAVAEENYFRGYEQALDDATNFNKNNNSELDKQQLKLVTDDED